MGKPEFYLSSIGIKSVDHVSDRLGCVARPERDRLGTGGEYFSIYVTIEEPIIYPTSEQAIKCLIVCQMLSNCYRDIRLFRFDEQMADVYILAGDNVQIIVPPSGNWRFVE